MGIPVVRGVLLRPRRDDDGFTLIETVCALVVFALMATGIAGVLLTTLAGNRQGLKYQQATRVAEQVTEYARSIGYASLATSSTDLAAAAGSDSTILGTCSGLTGFTYYFTPDGTSSCEGIVATSTGLALHPTSPIAGYSVERYVTAVNLGGTASAYKRITTHVTWTDHGVSKSYYTMTTVSDVTTVITTRDVAISGTTTNATAVPGYQAVFQNLITNKGTANDTFNVSVTATDASGNPVIWTKALYFDTYLDGSVQPYGKSSPATLLTDTNSDSTVDTGVLADKSGSCTPPGGSTTTCAQILLAVNVPSSAAAGTYTFVVTATSTHASTATATLTNTLVVSATPTPLNLYLHNVTCCPSPNLDSTQTLDMPMDTNTPTSMSEPNFSTNANNSSGRAISSGGNSGQTGTQKMADWVYGTLPTDSTFNGNITGTIYAQGCNSGNNTPSITVHFLVAPNGGDTGSTWIASSPTYAVQPPSPTNSCTGSQAQPVNFSIPVSNLTFGQSEVMELKVTASGANVVVDYDAVTFPSTLSFPVVAT